MRREASPSPPITDMAGWQPSSASAAAASAKRTLARRIRFIGRPERLDVGDEFPDLIRRDFAAPCRHAVLPPLGDRREDVGIRPAVIPQTVAQARPHAAAGMIAVAARAVVPVEQPASFAQHAQVVSVRVGRNRKCVGGTGLWSYVVRAAWLRTRGSKLVSLAAASDDNSRPQGHYPPVLPHNALLAHNENTYNMPPIAVFFFKSGTAPATPSAV